MRSVVETITPKKAQQWLTHNDKNRPLSMAWAEAIAEIIRRGEFELNGDAIRFNCDGTLIDGQHRLQAVVISGIPIKSLVVRGIESKAFNTIDQNKKRTVGDMLARDGERHYNMLASAVRFTYCYYADMMRSVISTSLKGATPFTPELAQKTLSAHPGLRKSADFISVHRKNLYFSGGFATAIHYIASKSSPQLADEYFAKLATGENICRTDAVYLVRQRLLKNAADQSKLRQHVLAAFIIKGWNATKANRKLGVLKWVDDEAFPEIA